MQILNLTQHTATTEQTAAGVIDLGPDQRAVLAQWLTFTSCPTRQEVLERAAQIAGGAASDSRTLGNVPVCTADHGGGAPFLMGALETALIARGIKPLYAFSVRESVESVDSTGKVTKTAVFRHAGFVPA